MANSSFRRPINNQSADQYDDPRDADPRAQASQESDPLAELARLIGQTDPLSNFGRAAPRQSAPSLEPQFEDERYQDERHAAPAPPADEVEETEPQPPAWLQSSQNWRHERHQEQRDDHDQHAAQPAQSEDFYPAEQRGYAHDERYAQDDRYADDQRYAQGTDQRYDDALYGRAPQYAEQVAQDGGPPYSYPGHEQGYDEYIPQEEPPSRRRGGLLTVAIVAALAVLGTAGAFGYRSYTGGPKGGEPPVIRADAAPTKVVPPAPSKDPSGKVITDRIGQAGERVVPREEAPVEVKNAAPRIVFPPLTQQAAPSTVAPAAGLAGGSGVSDEPKRIRTVSVRSDGTSAAPAPAASAPQAQPRPAPAPAASGNNPIQLTPPRTAPDPRPVAALPPAAAAPVASGGYVVQVSSQRSEADATASYRALQAKFPSVLGSRQPLIKRADLGTKGVYYRAMIGPFASQETASQLCGDLKTAGGQCVVQRN